MVVGLIARVAAAAGAKHVAKNVVKQSTRGAGPSGKALIHNVQHSTKKAAEQAAAQRKREHDAKIQVGCGVQIRFQVGCTVTVIATFRSLADNCRVELTEGMQGTVVEIDGKGDYKKNF